MRFEIKPMIEFDNNGLPYKPKPIICACALETYFGFKSCCSEIAM